jgi:hypothetical protein
MPRLPFQVNPAPQGMNSSAHPALLPANRCQRLVNFRADRAGRLRACLKLTDVATFAADGISYYYGEEAEDDRLLIVADGLLYVGVPVDVEADPVEWTFSAVGGGFTAGKAVRSVVYNTETFFVQEGGIQPLRYDGVGLYQVGITPPDAPVVAPGTPSSGSDNKSGTISYYLSYFDNRFRESDVSSGASINYTTHTGKAGFIFIEWGTDPQIYGAYVYATTSGATTKYRIATVLKSSGVFVVEDNFADNIVNTGTQAPNPGQYAIPNPASCIAIHKRHIVLNDTTDPSVLQINNLDAPTQWASVTTLATDGLRMNIGTHQGAGINALEPIGSLLMVATRAEMLQLFGDAPSGNSPFQLRTLHEGGVLAPSSFKWCGNVIVALTTDGKVRTTGGEDTFLIHEISADIEADLRQHTPAELEGAVAEFIESTYVLAIGDKVYCYDFSAGGSWYTIDLTTASIFVSLTGGGSVDANTPSHGASMGGGGLSVGQGGVILPEEP